MAKMKGKNQGIEQIEREQMKREQIEREQIERKAIDRSRLIRNPRNNQIVAWRKNIKNIQNAQRFQDWREEDWTQDMYGDVYNPSSRDNDVDNDELAAWEAAFMEGYEMAA